jgi:hypothetical protein
VHNEGRCSLRSDWWPHLMQRKLLCKVNYSSADISWGFLQFTLHNVPSWKWKAKYSSSKY